jgi:hypothetical protein
LHLVTVRRGVDNTVKELPAIRDTARKTIKIFDGLPAAEISTLYDELPPIAVKITVIPDDMAALTHGMTIIYDGLPAIRVALERLAVC